MKIMLLLFISMSVLFLNGCIIQKASEGKGERCELHHLKLHKSLVKLTYGAYCGPGTHLGPGGVNFPNAKHNKCGGCVMTMHRFAWMYTCRKCNKVKKEYDKAGAMILHPATGYSCGLISSEILSVN